MSTSSSRKEKEGKLGEQQLQQEWAQDAEEMVVFREERDGLAGFKVSSPSQQDIDAEKQNIRLEYFTDAKNYQNRY